MMDRARDAAKYANDDSWGRDSSGYYAPNELKPGDVVSVYIPKTKRFKDWGHHDITVIAVGVAGLNSQMVIASAPGYGSFKFTWNATFRRGSTPRSRLTYSFKYRDK